MEQAKFRRAAVIQNDIGDVFHFLVSGDRNRWQSGFLINRRIDCD